MSTSSPPPPPRKFRLGALDAATVFLLLFGGIWAFVGLTISVVFTVVGGPFWDDLALDRRGVGVVATPTDVHPTSSRINGRPVFRIHYEFVDPSGVSRTGACGTTDPRWIARANQRQPLEVECDPMQPTLSRLRGETASFFGLAVLMPFGFFVVGAAVFGVGTRRALRVRAIYVHGLPALATVTAISPTLMRVNMRRVMRVAYAFDAITGRVTGSATFRNPPPVGAQIWILHDPAEPKDNVAA